MSEELDNFVFKTAMGWVGVSASAKGLLAVTLPQSMDIEKATHIPSAFNNLVERLKAYYRGLEVIFPDKLDLTGATTFQYAVWTATQCIPYGETRGYRWIAERIGQPRATRAVGQALSRNPWAIIVPCHRVVASDGRLGGFGGGLAMKRRLLQMEAATRVRGANQRTGKGVRGIGC